MEQCVVLPASILNTVDQEKARTAELYEWQRPGGADGSTKRLILPASGQSTVQWNQSLTNCYSELTRHVLQGGQMDHVREGFPRFGYMKTGFVFI